MRRRLFQTLALVFALLAHVFVASGAFHDHLDPDRPGDCVSCGAAAQTGLVPVVVPLAQAPSTVAPLAERPSRAPARPLRLALDARGPPARVS